MKQIKKIGLIIKTIIKTDNKFYYFSDGTKDLIPVIQKNIKLSKLDLARIERDRKNANI